VQAALPAGRKGEKGEGTEVNVEKQVVSDAGPAAVAAGWLLYEEEYFADPFLAFVHSTLQYLL
jgi:hypothetical protein